MDKLTKQQEDLVCKLLHYYINDKGEHVYPEEWNESIRNMKSVKSYITESKMVSLIDYLKKMVG